MLFNAARLCLLLASLEAIVAEPATTSPATSENATAAAEPAVNASAAAEPAFPFVPVDGVDSFALHGNPVAKGGEPGKPVGETFTADCFSFVHGAVAKVYPQKVKKLSGLVRPQCKLPNAQVCDELADSLQQLVNRKQSEKAGVMVTSAGNGPKRYGEWCKLVRQEMLSPAPEQPPKADNSTVSRPGALSTAAAAAVEKALNQKPALRGASDQQKSSSKPTTPAAVADSDDWASADAGKKKEEEDPRTKHAAKARDLLDDFTKSVAASSAVDSSSAAVSWKMRKPVVFDDSALRREARALRVKRAAERLAAVGHFNLNDAVTKVAAEQEAEAAKTESDADDESEAKSVAAAAHLPAAGRGGGATKKGQKKAPICACVHRNGKKVCHCHATSAGGSQTTPGFLQTKVEADRLEIRDAISQLRRQEQSPQQADEEEDDSDDDDEEVVQGSADEQDDPADYSVHQFIAEDGGGRGSNQMDGDGEADDVLEAQQTGGQDDAADSADDDDGGDDSDLADESSEDEEDQ